MVPRPRLSDDLTDDANEPGVLPRTARRFSALDSLLMASLPAGAASPCCAFRETSRWQAGFNWVNESRVKNVEFVHEENWARWVEGNHLERALGGRRLKSYGKQPRKRQCKKARLAPQKDRAARGGEKGDNEKSEKVAAVAGAASERKGNDYEKENDSAVGGGAGSDRSDARAKS